MSKIILNGNIVNSTILDPRIHTYIGTFREPFEHIKNRKGGFIICECNSALTTIDQIFDHWQLGHFDIPQYVTLKKDD